MKPIDVLQQYWGFTEFRAGQARIIDTVLAGSDAVVVLPTGGGKSICYQIPALIRPGICLVISPLVALMQDQVDQLNGRGIKAISIGGGISFEALDRLLDNCIYGDYKFLYLSPERLQQDFVQGRIKQMQVSLIAIDEAHCISQWGHDFRPSYAQLSTLAELVPQTPRLALTATATDKVINDIAQQLLLNSPLIHRGSTLRTNLAYKAELKADKYKALVQHLNDNPGSAIVYLRSRRGCEQLAEWLNAQGHEAESYHGGLDLDLRKQRLSNWKESSDLTMVATNAFGMGIDKPDVRLVVHFQLPESIASYYQEAGRAGRDGEQAVAVVISSQNDIALARKQYIDQQPNLKFVRKVYKSLQQHLRIAYGEGAFEKYFFDFGGFCQDYKLPTGMTYRSFQLLDRLGILRLNPLFSQQTKVQFTAHKDAVMDFFDTHQSAAIIGQMLLRSYGGISETAVNVVLKPLARQLNRPERFLVEQLKFMAAQGIIDLQLHEADSEVTFLVPREDDRTINPFGKLITQYHNQKIKQLDALVDYLSNHQDCRQLLLDNYFDGSAQKACGICDNCAQKSLVNTNPSEIEEKVLEALKSGAKTRHQLAESLNFEPLAVGEALQQLINQGLVAFNPANKFILI